MIAPFRVAPDLARGIFVSYRRGFRKGFGREPTPDRFAFLAFGHVAETDAAARRGPQKLLWYIEAGKQKLQWAIPPGYMPAEAMVKLAGERTAAFRKMDIDFQIGFGNMFAGSPDTVVRQFRAFHDGVGGLGNLLLMGQAGHMSYDETASSLKLLSKEVMPQVKDLSAARKQAAE